MSRSPGRKGVTKTLEIRFAKPLQVLVGTRRIQFLYFPPKRGGNNSGDLTLTPFCERFEFIFSFEAHLNLRYKLLFFRAASLRQSCHRFKHYGVANRSSINPHSPDKALPGVAARARHRQEICQFDRHGCTGPGLTRSASGNSSYQQSGTNSYYPFPRGSNVLRSSIVGIG